MIVFSTLHNIYVDVLSCLDVGYNK